MDAPVWCSGCVAAGWDPEPVASNSTFFESPQAAAVHKHCFLRSYVFAWAGKVGSRAPGKKVFIYDAYSGPGRYDDQAPGSPELVVDTAIAMARLRTVHSIFSHKEPAYVGRLTDLLVEKGVTAETYGVRQGTKDTPMDTTTLIKDGLDGFNIELPSWAFGNAGTRFKVFGSPGVPRDPFEKIADAAEVNRLTGRASRVSLHVPWDKVDDWSALRRHAENLGVTLGAVNSNLFQDDEYCLGSLCHPDKAVRDKAIAHHQECIDVMHTIGSSDLKLWLPDGTNYPGQDSLYDRQERLADSLQRIYPLLGDNHRLLIEYKFYEPAFYSMDIPDWGTSLAHCLALGDKAQVVLDTGHHAPGTNIEFIVMMLLRAGHLGAFDFNSRFYGEDDLIVGAADPFQLFRILNEIVARGAHRPDSGVNYMLDQCHNIEPKIQGQIRSVMNVEEAIAKALIVDRAALEVAQREGDILTANAILMDAYATDTRTVLADLREEKGLPRDPIAAHRSSGYMEKVSEDRKGGVQMSWGS